MQVDNIAATVLGVAYAVTAILIFSLQVGGWVLPAAACRRRCCRRCRCYCRCYCRCRKVLHHPSYFSFFLLLPFLQNGYIDLFAE